MYGRLNDLTKMYCVCVCVCLCVVPSGTYVFSSFYTHTMYVCMYVCMFMYDGKRSSPFLCVHTLNYTDPCSLNI
jgi:hypothetical protein